MLALNPMKVAFQILIAFAVGVSGSFAAIIVPTAPDTAGQPVIASVAAMLKHDPKFFNGAAITDLTARSPHQVYTVALTNLAAGRLLSTAMPGSWRYLVCNGTNAIGEATLSSDDQGKLKLDAVSSTRFARETQVAIEKANADERLLNHDYELRYLLVPSVHFAAVWLHAEADDVIIPLPPTWNRMKDYQLYSENQVVQLLRPEAQRVARDEQEGAPAFRDADLAVVLSAFDSSSSSTTSRADDHGVDHRAGVSLGLGLSF
jgi:hypothetical protein